jgi:hypothetical protein
MMDPIAIIGVFLMAYCLGKAISRAMTTPRTKPGRRGKDGI